VLRCARCSTTRRPTRATGRAYDRNAERRLAADRLDLEALQPVLQGRIPLVVSASRESDIRAALAVARERRLKLVIADGVEAWLVAAELARDKVPVVLSPVSNLPSSFDDIRVRDDAAAVLAAAGVDVIISDLGSDGRWLRQNAGIAVQNGLPWDKALAALTTTPARVFGITDRGAIRPAAAADLVVWSGDPLELTSRAETVIIGGVVQPAATHQSRLLERYRKLPKN
jgi:imidazolonepropionase-like amidohydrolase